MRVVAATDGALYREIHAFAEEVFPEAKKYYHVTTDVTKIPALDSLTDDQLPMLFKQNETRQLIHITYGLILNAPDTTGGYRFKERLFSLWHKHAELYTKRLELHIDRHLHALYEDIK